MFGFQKRTKTAILIARVLSSTVSTLRLYGGGVGSCMCARFGLLGDLSWMKLKLNEAF